MNLFLKYGRFCGKLSVLFLLLAALFFGYGSPSRCLAAEKTYLITETQLMQLENNLAELNRQNKILQTQLQQSEKQLEESKQALAEQKQQSEMLQQQVQNLTIYLENAKTYLSKLEDRNNKNYAVGAGIGTNGMALMADINKTWIYLDKETAVLGIKYTF